MPENEIGVNADIGLTIKMYTDKTGLKLQYIHYGAYLSKVTI